MSKLVKNRIKTKLKIGDIVKVRTGKDKGKTGKLLKKLKNGRFIVEGINMVVKHQKPAPSQKQPGARKQIESSIHPSNVGFHDAAQDSAIRITYKIREDGKKVRISKATGEEIDV